MVTMTIPHPDLENRERSTPVYLAGPIMLTRTLTKESYVQFASFLRRKLEATGVDISNFRFSFITDAELPLFSAFKVVFPSSIHSLCVVHVRRALRRQMEKKYNMASCEVTKIMTHIFGSGGEVHQVGLIDAETEGEFIACLEKKQKEWPEPFQKFFTKNYKRRFIEKLIWPVRRDIGLGRDLGTTNHIESLHTQFKSTIGKRTEVETAVFRLGWIIPFLELHYLYANDENFILRYFRLLETQETDMFEALLDRGNYKLRQARRASLLIPPQDFNNEKIRRQKADMLFFCDSRTLGLKHALLRNEPPVSE